MKSRSKTKERTAAVPRLVDGSVRKLLHALAWREFATASPAIRRHLQILFATPGVNRDDLATVALSTLKQEPAIRGLLTARRRSQRALTQRLLDVGTERALDAPLLHSVLRGSIVKDVSWDRLLAGLRRSYLELVLKDAPQVCGPSHLQVLVSLACQCFNNEYVYFEKSGEAEKVRKLRRWAEGTVRAGPSSCTPMAWARLCCYGAYRPLGILRSSRRLALPAWSARAPVLRDLLRAQILEPMEEARLRDRIPSLGISANPVTRVVRRRYEESPYPRWLSLEITEEESLAEFLKRRMPSSPRIGAPRGKLEILVAGCGTGRDAIRDATEFRNARVTAVDLSRTSLGYAARKAAEYGVANLQFRHGDILALGRWRRRFQVIDSKGVLHHLQDTEAGLRTLVALLHPGGLLRLGLYSKLARRRFQAARKLVRRLGLTPSPDDVRLCRKKILDAPSNSALAVARDFSDFYMLSEMRDLLFHPHQREFSLNEIAGMLQRSGLEFLGFEGLSARDEEKFRRLFPQRGAERELALWDRFERKHPRTFTSCYIFWARKTT